jgi:hypothetical protein
MFGVSAFAAPSTEIFFHRRNHLGFSKTDNIVINGKHSFVNGLSLSKVPKKKLNPLIDKIVKSKSLSGAGCSAGEYDLKIKVKGKEKKYNGCVGTDAYATLETTVDEIKALARGGK